MDCVLAKDCPANMMADPSNNLGDGNGLCVSECPVGWYAYDFDADGIVCVTDCLQTSIVEGHTHRFK